MKTIESVPYVRVPIGWMRCIACSDFKQRPGTMWLGYTRGRGDDVIPCPVCHGTGQVERYQYLDARTGAEIDYERPGQTFVETKGPI